MNTRIARVFPRKTKASPDDPLAFFGPPGLFVPEVDEVHVSVAFTWDIPKAELFARQWEGIAPVKIGGPALGDPGGDFIPGMYVKKGYVMTSRGCPNRCWFCSVWKREGGIRELPVMEGFNVLDSNLLACSQEHQEKVFQMLRRQTEPIRFTGGLEAKRFTKWHVGQIKSLKFKLAFFAYDTPDDLPPLVSASVLLTESGLINSAHSIRCYVLCGYEKDTINDAQRRMEEVVELGIMPMAMLYNQGRELPDRESWRRFQREWTRPHILGAKMRKM